jgi:hypothetical protein
MILVFTTISFHDNFRARQSRQSGLDEVKNQLKLEILGSPAEAIMLWPCRMPRGRQTKPRH